MPHRGPAVVQARRNVIRGAIESLEARRLLSVAVTNGVLTLSGTGNRDTYFVNKSGTNLTVVENGGATKTFAYASVASISAILAGGNDSITIATTVLKPSYISGGAGDDAIIGGGGDDEIDPGTGDDYVEGRTGNDTLSYASRSDAVVGGIVAHFFRTVADPLGFELRGAAGATGEHDTSLSCEAIYGGSGDDTLSVGAETWADRADKLHPDVPLLRVDGNGGNDELHASNAASENGYSQAFPLVVANGGEGDDHFAVSDQSTKSAVTLNGGGGNDLVERNGAFGSATITFGSGSDTYNDYSPNVHDYTMPPDLERLYIEAGGKVIGNDLNNSIDGVAAYVDAGKGDDRVDARAPTVYGGDGNDIIVGRFGLRYVDAGDGTDTVIAGGSDLDALTNLYVPTTVLGGAGDDELNLLAGQSETPVRQIVFDGGTGSNRVIIDDEALRVAHNYRLDTGVLSRYRVGAENASVSPDTVSLTNTQSILMLGANIDPGNRFDIFGTPASVQGVFLTGGNGVDLYDVHETGPGGEVTVTTYDGNDRLVVDSESTRPARANIVYSSAFDDITLGRNASLRASYSDNEANLLRTKTLSISPGATLDLLNNLFVIDPKTGVPHDSAFVSAIESLVRSGRNGGTWDGSGIISSLASYRPGVTLGVGLRSKIANFPAQPVGGGVDPTSVVVRYTRSGDVNLDRTVNFADFVIVSQSYGKNGQHYAQGDVNYSADGKVDFDDIVTLSQNYGSSLNAGSLTAAFAATKKQRVAASII